METRRSWFHPNVNATEMPEDLMQIDTEKSELSIKTTRVVTGVLMLMLLRRLLKDSV
jgi:hypothetical protein